MINVFLAEDQEMLQTALVSILNLENDINVLAASSRGDLAYQEIMRLNPQVTILDIEMPGLTGLQVVAKLRQSDYKGKIIILTTFARQDYFEQAVELEVDGYLLKDAPTEKLIQSIHEIDQGNVLYSPELVRHVLRSDKNPLTVREIELLRLISAGINTADIADKLYLSQGTVRNYISSILSKTGAQSRIEAVKIAEKYYWI